MDTLRLGGEREFVALGAALASNCLPCIEYRRIEARKAGITDAQILEVVGLADTVRRMPARQVLAKAHALWRVRPRTERAVRPIAPADRRRIDGPRTVR